MLENAIDRSSSEQGMRTVISVGETISYEELLDLCENINTIKAIEAEMLYMDAFECMLEIATICHDVTNNKIYLMCKSCAPMYDFLVDKLLDVRQLDDKCEFLESKSVQDLLSLETSNNPEIWMAVHSHINNMLFMLAPITMAGPAISRLPDGQCVSKNDTVSFWGEM